MMPPRVFFALHDVTPFHAERIERAERLFALWGIKKIAYLLIPNYHGAYRADRQQDFVAWCRRSRPFEVSWFLHGYFHRVTQRATTARDGILPYAPLSDPEVAETEALCAAGKTSLLGALPVGSPRVDEGEFRDLTVAAMLDRLVLGREVFCCTLGSEPCGFVAPKWQADHRLPALLGNLGGAWTEDKTLVRHLPTGLRWRMPVITWATRSWWRKRLSLYGTPLLHRFVKRVPNLRIAMHPFDFDHPETVDCIRQIVDRALAERQQALYDDLLAAGSPRIAA